MDPSISKVASAQQKGQAAELRTRIYDKLLYSQLNQIVHSGDTKNSRFGKMKNSFRDLDNKYSKEAEKVLLKAEQKRRELKQFENNFGRNLKYKKTLGRGVRKS